MNYLNILANSVIEFYLCIKIFFKFSDKEKYIINITKQKYLYKLHIYLNNPLFDFYSKRIL